MTFDNNQDTDIQIPEVFRDFTNKEFLSFGLHDMAYVRAVDVDGRTAYAIHAADGTPLSVMEDRANAERTISNNDMDVATLQ